MANKYHSKAKGSFKLSQQKLKKILIKKKGKDLDWSDVKKSYKIFTKK